MTKRKSLWTRVTSFMAAMVFSMTLLLVFPENTFTVTADSVITAEEANMIITGVIELNGVPLAEGSEVKNGDVLSLDVNWSLPDDFENVNGTFSYDLTDKLFGITLDDIVIPVGNTAVYQVKDNVLYIKLLAGHSNRYGDCSLSGSVNVAEDEVGDGGSFELKFIGTPEGNNDTVPVTVTNYVPGLSVSKTASGSVTYENGTYYQSFNISLSSYNQESTGVKISDLADSGYDFSQLTDFTVKYNGYGMEAVDYTLTNTANGFDIEINSPVGTEWGEYITIGYKVPVDVYDVINGTETAVNKITATADNQTEKDDTAKASITEPIISKIGSYDSEAGTITWTITVYPNTLTAENPSFVITEIPGKNLDEDELKAIFGDDMQITSDELTLVDGKYVLTYTTTAESSPIQDTYYSNSAKVKFENIDKEYTTSEMTVYVPKSLSDFVEKTYSMPNADGTIPWSIKVSLPDADVTNISIYDYTDNYSIAMNQSMFTVTGADGTVGTIASSKDTMSSDDVGYANWYGSQIDFDITDSDFLAANKGKDIVVNYTMTLPEGVTSIQNTASVTLTIDGVAVNDYDTETFAPDFTASKYTNIDMSQFTQDESYNFPILWGIRIKGDEHFVAGDTIVAEDTIPDGLEFIDGAVIVCVDSDNGYGTNFSNLLTTTVLGNTVKFELTVTEKLINETMKYDDGSYTNVMPIRIVYLTYADDDVTAIYQNGSKTYTNSASVTVNNVPVGTVTAEKTITAQTGDVVTKEAVSTGVEGDNVGAYTYAEYQIVINPDAVKLSNNTTITATDTLGANLTLVGTPVITPTDGASFSYSGNVLDFILNDETTYTITYRVKVSTVDKDKVENGSYTDEQLTDMFGNTIIVDVAGSTDFSTSSPFSVINYTHDASFSFDEQEKAITIKGTKSWEQDDKDIDARPSKIVITLTAKRYDTNGTYLSSATSTYEVDAPADNGAWEYTIENLPTLEPDTGVTIKYDVTEIKADGYSVTYDDGNQTGITRVDDDTTEYTVDITNTFTAVSDEVGSLTVTKEWVGDTESDRPEINITVVDVSGNGSYSQTKTLSGNSVIFENLPLYIYSRDADDNLVRELRYYAITEAVVNANDQSMLDNYTLTKSYEGDSFALTDKIEANYALTTAVEQTLTNTYSAVTPAETISISGAKTWDDNNDQDGKRPTSITVKLMNGETFVESKNVTEADNWEYTFADLAKYDGGNGIVYTIEEVAVDGYVTSYNGYDIPNTYTTETISISGTKTWDDNNDQDGKRPTSITVNLMNGETLVESKNVTAADNWEYTFDNLAKYDGGNEIVYSVEEVAVDGYTTTYNGYDITNTYTTETISISGTKTWDDSNNQDGKRPTSITVNLYGNGTYVDSKTVTAADNWEYSFTGLDKYSNGKLITYSVAEEAVYGYTPVYNGYDITNVYTFPYISVQVTKVWDDDNNRDGKRPESVNVVLSPTGDTVALSAANNWTYIFKDLPAKDADDNDINYTVTEDSVDGYTATYNGYDITNTRVPETTSVSGTKTWDDSNDQNGKRPTSITVNLYGNGTYVDSKTVTEADNWEYSFDNLYMYENGVKINYTVTEDNVDGYTATYNGYDITNTYTTVVTPAETVDISVTKTWDDSNDADGIRPTELEITLKRDGVAIQTMKSDWVKNGNTWTYTFTGLPKYPTGSTTEYVYTVEEEDLTAIGYTGSSTSTQYSFGFVNKYTSTTPNTPNVPNVPSVPNPVNPTVPNTPVTPFIPQAPEDVSSESGIDAESDMLGSVDTSSFTFIAILLAITAGGIVIARRRQK